MLEALNVSHNIFSTRTISQKYLRTSYDDLLCVAQFLTATIKLTSKCTNKNVTSLNLYKYYSLAVSLKIVQRDLLNVRFASSQCCDCPSARNSKSKEENSTRINLASIYWQKPRVENVVFLER